MSLITSVSRVRNRMGFTTSDLTDPILEEFIADQQAFFEDTLDKTFAQDDDGFELARSVVTDLSTMRALICLIDGTTTATGTFLLSSNEAGTGASTATGDWAVCEEARPGRRTRPTGVQPTGR